MAVQHEPTIAAPSTTRRQVIGTGVKLAYAAPLVAASMKLSADGTVAALSGCGEPYDSGLFVVQCTTSGQACSPAFEATVCSLSGEMSAQYTTHPNHCSDILIQFFVDGAPATGLIGPLGPISGVLTTGPVGLLTTPGVHVVAIQATGVLGGCNGGVLAAWGGTLAITPN